MPLTKKNNKRRSTSTPTPKTKVTPFYGLQHYLICEDSMMEPINLGF